MKSFIKIKKDVTTLTKHCKNAQWACHHDVLIKFLYHGAESTLMTRPSHPVISSACITNEFTLYRQRCVWHLEVYLAASQHSFFLISMKSMAARSLCSKAVRWVWSVYPCSSSLLYLFIHFFILLVINNPIYMFLEVRHRRWGYFHSQTSHNYPKYKK